MMLDSPEWESASELERSKLEVAARMVELNIPAEDGEVLWQALSAGRVMFIDRRGPEDRCGLILPDADGRIRI